MSAVPGWYFCLKCGHELGPDARYCPRCGHPVSGTSTPPSRYRNDPVAWVGGEQLPLASFGKRFGAAVLDWLILGAGFYGAILVGLIMIVVVSTDPSARSPEPAVDLSSAVVAWWLFGMSLLLWLGQWALDSFGWSPGKAANGIRTVRLDGRRPGILHGLVRYAMRTISLLVFGLGYFWAIWDDRNQTWHDKLAGTVVVRAGPLSERIPDRRPDPLVTRSRIWWLAVLATTLLTASLALDAWWISRLDGNAFGDPYYIPGQREASPRIQEFDAAWWSLPDDVLI